MSKRDNDLERELAFHLEQHAANLIAAGVDPAEARRRARLEIGGLAQVREQCRDERPARRLERLPAEFGYALRGLRRHPASAAAIVLTVAVCIALNTAVFGVVDSLLLRPLPFHRADRLVFLTNQYPKAGIDNQDGSASGDYFDRRAGAVPALAEHAIFRAVANTLELGGTPVQVRGLSIAPSLLPLLRVRPAAGRAFTEAEAEPGAHPSVILTDGLAREAFGGAGAAIGRAVRISGRNATVAGVMPRGFRFLSPAFRYFLPLALTAEDNQSRHSNNYQYIGRLRDGATAAQAEAQVAALNASLLNRQPELKELIVNAGFHTQVRELQPWLMRGVRSSLALLWAGAALVLLIGAVNLAGLSLARAHARSREAATRLALGASRGDLARLCLLENVLPALAGAALGIGAGVLALRAFDHGLLPGAAEIGLSASVVAYAFAGAAAAGVLVGFASLIPARKLDLARSMQDGGRGGTARGAKLRRALVVVQVGLAFVLLNGAGLLAASLRELLRVDPGFQTGNVWTAATFLPNATFPRAQDVLTAMRRASAALAGLPRVERASAASSVPFGDNYNDNVILAEGYAMKPGESAISPTQLEVMPGYFETLGIRLVEGRTFTERDDASAPRMVIVDEQLARRFWPGASPVGRRMRYPNAPPQATMTVAGVVRSIRLESLAGGGNPNGVYYVPWLQAGTRVFSLVWRGGAPAVPSVRQAFAAALPGAALFDLHSLAERQDITLASRRLTQSLALCFAAIAVLLAAIGLYGLLAFLLAQRRREVGIRVAMGCRPAGVFGLFLNDGLKLTAAGLAAGLLLTAALKPWIAAQLYGVGPMDPLVVCLAALALALVAAAAVCIPAWRATRIDPACVLAEM